MTNIRTLDFYGFDGDNTMYDTNSYPISKASEVENEKYVKETEDNATNDETEPTVDGGETPTTELTEPTDTESGDTETNG
jgi:hypothetical protein